MTVRAISDFITLIRDEKSYLKLRRTPSKLGICIFDSINYVPEYEWNKIVPGSRGLMRHPYLRAIENSSAKDETSRYVLMYRDKVPVAAAIFHVTTITGHDYRSRKSVNENLEKFKSSIREKAKIRILVCGHTHISGDHGFIYSPEISSQEAYHALADACYQIRRSEKLRGRIDLMLIKDFYQEEYEAASHLKAFKYRQFQVDPNMVLKIRPDWNSFEDYLNAMISKYRTRTRSVVKQGLSLERRRLTGDEMTENFERIQTLYMNVADKAKVRINHFDTSYLVQLKRNLGDDVIFTAYYVGNDMVGFSTAILWGDNAEGHAIGINYELNSEHAIYQNILYDYARTAIESKKSKLILGRTAMEMKSNIGAEPAEMYCYVRHSTPLLNRAFKPVLNYIKQTEWTQRKPFKQ